MFTCGVRAAAESLESVFLGIVLADRLKGVRLVIIIARGKMFNISPLERNMAEQMPHRKYVPLMSKVCTPLSGRRFGRLKFLYHGTGVGHSDLLAITTTNYLRAVMVV